MTPIKCDCYQCVRSCFIELKPGVPPWPAMHSLLDHVSYGDEEDEEKESNV